MKHSAIRQIISSEAKKYTDIKSYVPVLFTFLDCIFRPFTDRAAEGQNLIK